METNKNWSLPPWGLDSPLYILHSGNHKARKSHERKVTYRRRRPESFTGEFLITVAGFVLFSYSSLVLLILLELIEISSDESDEVQLKQIEASM